MVIITCERWELARIRDSLDSCDAITGSDCDGSHRVALGHPTVFERNKIGLTLRSGYRFTIINNKLLHQIGVLFESRPYSLSQKYSKLRQGPCWLMVIRKGWGGAKTPNVTCQLLGDCFEGHEYRDTVVSTRKDLWI